VSRTFRLSMKQRIPPTLSVVPMFLVQATNRTPNVAELLFVAMVGVASVHFTRRFGVTLSADGIVAYGLRTRFLPWPAIRDIRTEEMLGSHFVVVVTDRGRTRLRAPTTGFLQHDADFDDKYARIVSCWHAHGDID
jgi:hypothetical protein